MSIETIRWFAIPVMVVGIIALIILSLTNRGVRVWRAILIVTTVLLLIVNVPLYFLTAINLLEQYMMCWAAFK